MRIQSPNAVPTDVYLSFVSSLFGNRQTLFTGMVVHILTYAAVYAKTGDSFYVSLTAVFLAVCIFRIYWFQRFDAVSKAGLSHREIALWENRYLWGGVATTAILGIGSAYAIAFARDQFAILACVAVTLASMVSVVGRNYGSSRAVNLQTLTACLPIMIGFALVSDPFMVAFAGLLIPFLLTTRMMANGVREFLYNNVIASREKAELVDRFDMALNNMPHGLFMLDANNRILVVNRKACDLLKLGDQERLKDCDLDLVLRYGARHSFIDGSLPALIQRQLAQLVDGTLSRTLVQYSDDLFLEFSASRRPDGVVVLIFEDVTARIRAERRVLHMVRYDPLTGLPNREHFSELVQERLAALADRQLVGLLLIDVDEFKHVNDMKGHVAGDRLLCQIAHRLTAVAGSEAIVGHLMGDQFVVFVHGNGRVGVEGLIRRLHADMRGSFDVDGSQMRITFSAGALVTPRAQLRMEEWQIKVDLALFEAKYKARGTCAFFEQEMDARYVDHQRLKVELRDAVEAGSLHVLYQPMYRPDGHSIECCEALTRWVHPERGAIPPSSFIQLAEEMGIVSDITHFVIRQACLDCATWDAGMSVSVNLSVHDLRNDRIVAAVERALAESGLHPSRLHLEITESCLVEEPATVQNILNIFRNRGITIALDDFGTGFSSLSYLDALPVDIVKIDRSFVRNIGEDARRLKLLRGTVNLIRELGLGITIEGVETEDQLELINRYRCADLIQGYVFSAAVPPENIAILAEEQAVRSAQAAS
ncbi:putative bifunctional diguanylate cyclase/phosphodiesterase [Gellertiella hungarica]|uniref:Diguanylate cyclase (GGDEF)-like protein n=1 Tax=Gellertiella hungarica TaxID=1572859 RepID=A0A7W6J1F2_9HYPH|nr:EAL domain-containing protein [Gellertiella hungarica]MBB4063031.1 diguanylate cyclase (GGDEF)-like protein [Gellertiella hungarica]